MRDIAAEAGINIATLYFHVGTKEQLFLEVLDAQRVRFWEGLQAAVAAAAPSWSERLAAAITFHVISRCEPHSGPLLRTGELQRLTGELRDRYMARRDEYEHLFRDLIAGGIAAGEFAAVDEKVAAAGIIGLGNAVAAWYQPTGRLSPQAIAGQYVMLLMRGLDVRP
jgi:AcrR family transcriptional regulator